MALTFSLAPIRGITDAIFRTCFSRHFKGITYALSPFITTVNAARVNPSHLADILPKKNTGMPVVPQILGNNGDHIRILAAACADLGYACVNLNLGCPFPQVVNKKRGSGLLPHADRIQHILDTVLPGLPCRLSLKTRLGLADCGELLSLMPLLNKYPLEEIIIHARLGKQRYSGTVDLAGFKACAQASKQTIVYNGDIVSQESFTAISAALPMVDCFMIGRGVLANPLLAEEILGITSTASASTRLSAFCADLYECYRALLPKGDRAILGRMKGIWFYLAESFTDKEDFLKKIQRCKTITEYLALTDDIFSSAC